jgi:hypothetical protein
MRISVTFLLEQTNGSGPGKRFSLLADAWPVSCFVSLSQARGFVMQNLTKASRKLFRCSGSPILYNPFGRKRCCISPHRRGPRSNLLTARDLVGNVSNSRQDAEDPAQDEAIDDDNGASKPGC